LLVEFRKEKMLAEAIILLLQNPAWAQGLGESGHKKVLARYNWPIIAQRFRETYEIAIQGVRTNPI
jgi:glycosyltransferase involved in cell wall biosynthesis